MPPRLLYALLALAIFVIEVLIATRFVDLSFIRGSVGDFLVAGLLYCLAQAIRPSQPGPLACAVFVFSCVVEAAQYIHLADLLGFARGSVWHVLLGNVFSWLDIVMYLLGCAAAYGLDVLYRRKQAVH
ncbi:DUF2809 domain-containing protein [Massilia sp. W12]|uniref:ribosomal maturation YjgA family protein n=1 Tax=Massilia sp. W12 TaxID=3126507 RepID=UPI0030CBF185